MVENKIQTLERAVVILNCFSLDKPSLGVREVARQTNLSPSTVGRMMGYMKDQGILNQDPETFQYMMGSKVLEWAGIYNLTNDVRTLSLPVMVRLQEQTRETISLYVLEDNERVCVERLESPETVRIVARIGRRIPLYAGSAGKVFLAFLPENQREDILREIDLIPMTERTITDLEVLRADLDQIRKLGYAVSKGEWIIDASGVAAPIFDQMSRITAAMTISGPAQRFTDSTIKEIAILLLKEVKQISFELGYYPR
ncbi:MAG: IclR family transcriptional regulator [Pelolinea sp.]|nr:IclR family transcriptional regulator [Pelolinea sp.]